MGWEVDCNSCFPRARVAMVPIGRAQGQFLIDHKDDIMRKYAEFLFPTLPWTAPGAQPQQKKRMKAIINGFDMDSGLEAWGKQYDNPDGKKLKGTQLTLGCGTPYALESYHKAQRKGTEWVAANSKRMLELVEQCMKPGERTHAGKAALRVKSYLLQEAEAVSRGAKDAWCREHGVRVLNLQHDGIMIGSDLPNELSADEVAELMGAAATRAAGYEVVVTAERVGITPLVVD